MNDRALYFPQSNLILRLPYLANKNADFNSNIKLLTLQTLRNDSTVPKEVKYHISSTYDKIVIFDEKTNTIWLRTLPKNNVSGTIIVQAKENGGDEAFLEIKIQPLPTRQNKINCADYVQDMCFWNSSRYRIYENQPATMLGSFAPEIYNDICPDFRVTKYELLNGTNYFHTINNILYANSSLDRDVLGPTGGPGPQVNIEIRCIVYEETTGKQHALIHILGVDILDQDDNPPIAQMDTVVEITLRDFTVGDRLDENNLMVKDADDINSNRYIVRILGDIHNALNITYDTIPIEHPKHPQNPASTAIFTRIYAKTTLLPKSPYRVILQVKDESLLPGYGENSVSCVYFSVTKLTLIKVGKEKDEGCEREGKEDKNEASSKSCGATCIISVSSTAIFIFIGIVGFLASWSYRLAVKSTHRECKHRVDDGSNGMGILPSDYIDRGDSLPISVDTFATVNRHLLPKTCPPDPKWEFPRSRLTIEQVLGEGEFGRVLRAKAIDIGGWLGPTTVAVKTLKEDACASELADLLSEYQLLKEAQHPNVIRLLGACTSPGGPVYLIIEFAEFGSLRNYLRRSRHLESEGKVLCLTSLLSTSPNNMREELQQVDTLSNYTITPRDILSFAWQISKGMAYLADIKVKFYPFINNHICF
ncbi:hypothetical protein HZH68_011919 [Vespula germanica]|uniref:Protein kinase domain-containing protein n=1 Tax=Vespula germanica TaxID=30212 RepID=A0A834MYR8_VESGE|nr:hypothetical protein HZH68_011919 [Vespula germanica]